MTEVPTAYRGRENSQPIYVDVVPDPPVRLAQRTDRPDGVLLSAAALRVTRLHPGPIGELVAHEILDFAKFGSSFGADSLVMRAVRHIMAIPLESL